MTLLVAVCVTGFFQLGRWQWHRAQEASRQDSAYAGGARAAPVDLARAPLGALPRYTAALARGRYDSAHQFLLDNISVHGEPGYEVLTPLRLSDGRTVIVNRGWVPLTASRRDLPDVQVPDGEVRAVGRLDDLPVVGISLGHVPPAAGSRWPKLTSFPTMADLAAALGRPLEPRQLLLDPDQPLGYLRDWQPSDAGPVQHLSYAAQWWAFAIITLGLYVWLNRPRTGPAPLRGPFPPGTALRKGGGP